jgi:chromosome segregation ATPase
MIAASPIRASWIWPWTRPESSGNPPNPSDPSLSQRLDSLQAAFTAHTEAIEAETHQLRIDLATARAIASDHAHDLDQAHRAIGNQSQLIVSLQGENDRQKTVEQQVRGELREAYSRITALEQQLSEERTARTKQAEQNGYLQSQLDQADKRLGQQRQLIEDQGKQLAVLQDQRLISTGQIAGLQMALDIAVAERDQALATLTALTPPPTESDRSA